ncbi:MAG: class I SAM-dependent methyltransferase family protein [Candidatus Aenigmarchaeota archaeon]|nr:class I SAM-dependent methyltransferase family protein [Candidatus Aenigmarchaeota archaeon]MDW8160280.1 class I SAM-dependent methyltransferase family protein [Candidatus Aenigmarchaeota archaeon]
MKDGDGILKRDVENFVDLEKIKERPHSFDVIGHIAIIEFPFEKSEEEKVEIAKLIMSLNKNIRTVLEKVSERKGIYRIRNYKFLAGEKNTETTHKEYGCIFTLDPTKVYFSPRELTERQRIAEKVKDGEEVLVMFSGVAPYPIQIVKKRPNVKKVVAIEINPIAVEYARKNVRINKMGDKIQIIEGDVRDLKPEFFDRFDRIVMPLPLGAENFLDIAVRYIKNRGTIHFYNWGAEPNIFENGEKLIAESFNKMGVKYKILEKRKVLPYGPRKWKVCFDLMIEKH